MASNGINKSILEATRRMQAENGLMPFELSNDLAMRLEAIERYPAQAFYRLYNSYYEKTVLNPAPPPPTTTATVAAEPVLDNAKAVAVGGDSPKCTICCDQPLEFAMQCGHMFCRACMCKFTVHACPFCKKPMRDPRRVYL